MAPNTRGWKGFVKNVKLPWLLWLALKMMVAVSYMNGVVASATEFRSKLMAKELAARSTSCRQSCQMVDHVRVVLTKTTYQIEITT